MRSKSFIIFALCLCFLTSCTPVINIDGNENSSTIVYNGDEYRCELFYCADDDRILIGHLNNMFGADVYSIGSNEYIEIVGDDNSGFFIKNGSEIPTSGTVTKVLVDPAYRGDNSKYLESDNELSMIEELTNLSGDLQVFDVNNYYTDGSSFYYVYNNSNISCKDNYGGYIAYTNGKWIYAPADEKPVDNKDGSNANSVTIQAILIDDEKLIKQMCESDLTKYINCK